MEAENKKGLLGGGSIAAPILIAAFSYLLYMGTLQFDFVYDDLALVPGNEWIRSPANIPEIFSSNMWGFGPGGRSNYYRPLIHLLLMLDYLLFGLKPWGYHLMNILFHSANSVLVFLIASHILRIMPKDRFTGSFWAPFVAGVLFASHPVHTEAVAWVSGLSDLSLTFFFLLSFYLFARATEEGHIRKGFYIGSLLSFFAAMLSKEAGVVLPAALFLYARSFGRKISWRPYIPFLVAIGAYLGMRTYALREFLPSLETGRPELSSFQYFINIFPLFVKYIEKLLLPVDLSAYYEFFIRSLSEPAGYISAGVTAFFLALLFLAYKKDREVFFPLSFIVLALLPGLYIRAIPGSVLSERYLYLPSFAFIFLCGIVFKRVKSLNGKAALSAYICVFLLAAFYSAGTLKRNPVWKDELSLWTDTAAKAPHSDRVRANYGKALLSSGRMDEAIRELRQAIALNPGSAVPHSNLGIAYDGKGWIDRAIEEFKAAIRIEPEYANAHYNLGVAYMKKGAHDKAIEEFEITLRLDPAHFQARDNLEIAKTSLPSSF